jgi:hypothetical protein
MDDTGFKVAFLKQLSISSLSHLTIFPQPYLAISQKSLVIPNRAEVRGEESAVLSVTAISFSGHPPRAPQRCLFDTLCINFPTDYELSHRTQQPNAVKPNHPQIFPNCADQSPVAPWKSGASAPRKESKTG